MLSKYIEIPPSNQLKNHVECFWVMKKEASYQIVNDVIIPNGCSEIVFPSGEGYFRSIDGVSYKKINKAVVIGQQDGFVLLKEMQDNSIDFGVRFTPYGFTPFLNKKFQITNELKSLNHFFGKSVLNFNQKISQAITIDDKLICLEDFIIKQIPKATPINSLVKDSVYLINQSQGKLKVNDLLEILGTTKSTLYRAFIQATGYNPKRFISISRINYLIQYYTNNTLSLTQLAYQFNYSDQSHFINDFKRYTGLNPSLYFNKNLPLTHVLVKEVTTRNRVYY